MHGVWRDMSGDVDEKVEINDSDGFGFGAPVCAALGVRTRDAVCAVFSMFTVDAKQELGRCLGMGQEESVKGFACIRTANKSWICIVGAQQSYRLRSNGGHGRQWYLRRLQSILPHKERMPEGAPPHQAVHRCWN